MRPGEVRYVLGDVVRMKKPHPCGADTWQVWRTGIDFGIKCLGCGRRVMIPRRKFERSVKALIERGPEARGAAGESPRAKGGSGEPRP